MPEAKARAVAAVVRGSLAAGAEAQRRRRLGSSRAGAQRVLELRRRRARRQESARRDGGDRRKGQGHRRQRARSALSEHLRAMAALLRDLGVLATRADAGAVANVDLRPALEALSPSFDRRPRPSARLTAVDSRPGALERNASPKTVADWMVLQL